MKALVVIQEAVQKTAAEESTSSAESAHAPTPDALAGEDEHEHGVDRIELLRIVVVGLAVLVTWLRLSLRLGGVDPVPWAATLIGVYPIAKEAFSAIRARRMTMELSMSVALAAALSIGEVFTALVIVFFVLVAEVLEHLTVGRGRKAIHDLMDFLPRGVSVRREGRIVDLPIAKLHLGDVVVVKPGGRVPVDGNVVAGDSFVDQSMVTGESLPVEKSAGASVFAGTVNQSGMLEVRAVGVGHDTAFGRIVQAVEHAEKSRAPIQKTADRLAGYLVYFALASAVVTFLLTHDVRATISVIIVAGACGIAAGTPLAILGAIGQAAKHGAIIKGGLHLESLGDVDTLVLDKTGTLTLGSPQVVSVSLAPGVLESDLLRAAATAEAASEHPLATAVLERAGAAGIVPERTESFAYVPGRGIVCSSSGAVIVVGNEALLNERGVAVKHLGAPCNIHVARDWKYLGGLLVTDTVRPEAKAAMAQLKMMGLQLVLLTGDAVAVAEEVGAELGFDNVRANLLPEQKMAHIRYLQIAGRKVAMVGDGVNDAPALTEALVGIGMGSGTEIAREAADIVLLGNDLLKLVEALKIARRCKVIIRQNFIGTIAVDAIGILLAALNILSPLSAAFIHVVSELAFILNSTRLLPSVDRARQAFRAR